MKERKFQRPKRARPKKIKNNDRNQISIDGVPLVHENIKQLRRIHHAKMKAI